MEPTSLRQSPQGRPQGRVRLGRHWLCVEKFETAVRCLGSNGATAAATAIASHKMVLAWPYRQADASGMAQDWSTHSKYHHATYKGMVRRNCQWQHPSKGELDGGMRAKRHLNPEKMKPIQNYEDAKGFVEGTP
jgi:hypothetical protein